MPTDDIQRSLGRIEGALDALRENQALTTKLLERNTRQIEELNAFRNKMVGITVIIGALGAWLGEWIKTKFGGI